MLPSSLLYNNDRLSMRSDLSGNQIHTIEWGELLSGLPSLSQLCGCSRSMIPHGLKYVPNRLLKGNPICSRPPGGTLKSIVFRAVGKPSLISGVPAGVDVQC